MNARRVAFKTPIKSAFTHLLFLASVHKSLRREREFEIVKINQAQHNLKTDLAY